MRRRIGVFGGTFDPVHYGHLLMAEEARVRLDLALVHFVPAGRPAHKRDRPITPPSHRLAMLRLAIRGNPSFRISAVEAGRDAVSFTVDTLNTLAATERGDLYLLLGQDSLAEFDTWRDPDEILGLARLAVFPRGDAEGISLRPSLRRRVVFLHPPRIGIAASEIRRRLKRRLSVRYWLPDPVIAYATRHGLYGPRRGRR